jgi:hypothetical protein
LGSVNSPNPILLILLKKGFPLWSRSRIIKVFCLYDKLPLKGFTQVLVSFKIHQRKGSIQPLPIRQRYSPPLDPNAIKSMIKARLIIFMLSIFVFLILISLAQANQTNLTEMPIAPSTSTIIPSVVSPTASPINIKEAKFRVGPTIKINPINNNIYNRKCV